MSGAPQRRSFGLMGGSKKAAMVVKFRGARIPIFIGSAEMQGKVDKNRQIVRIEPTATIVFLIATFAFIIFGKPETRR